MRNDYLPPRTSPDRLGIQLWRNNLSSQKGEGRIDSPIFIAPATQPKKKFQCQIVVSIVLFPLLSLFEFPSNQKRKRRRKRRREKERLVAFKRRCGRSGDGGLPSFNFFKKEFLREGEKRKKRPKGRERAIKQMAASTEILVRSFVQLFLVFWFFHVWFVFHANDWGTLIIMYTYLYTHVVF